MSQASQPKQPATLDNGEVARVAGMDGGQTDETSGGAQVADANGSRLAETLKPLAQRPTCDEAGAARHLSRQGGGEEGGQNRVSRGSEADKTEGWESPLRACFDAYSLRVEPECGGPRPLGESGSGRPRSGCQAQPAHAECGRSQMRDPQTAAEVREGSRSAKRDKETCAEGSQDPQLERVAMGGPLSYEAGNAARPVASFGEHGDFSPPCGLIEARHLSCGGHSSVGDFDMGGAPPEHLGMSGNAIPLQPAAAGVNGDFMDGELRAAPLSSQPSEATAVGGSQKHAGPRTSCQEAVRAAATSNTTVRRFQASPGVSAFAQTRMVSSPLPRSLHVDDEECRGQVEEMGVQATDPFVDQPEFQEMPCDNGGLFHKVWQLRAGPSGNDAEAGRACSSTDHPMSHRAEAFGRERLQGHLGVCRSLDGDSRADLWPSPEGHGDRRKPQEKYVPCSTPTSLRESSPSGSASSASGCCDPNPPSTSPGPAESSAAGADRHRWNRNTNAEPLGGTMGPVTRKAARSPAGSAATGESLAENEQPAVQCGGIDFSGQRNVLPNGSLVSAPPPIKPAGVCKSSSEGPFVLPKSGHASTAEEQPVTHEVGSLGVPIAMA